MEQKQKEVMSIAEAKSSIFDASSEQHFDSSSYQGESNTKVNQITVKSLEEFFKA